MPHPTSCGAPLIVMSCCFALFVGLAEGGCSLLADGVERIPFAVAGGEVDEVDIDD